MQAGKCLKCMFKSHANASARLFVCFASPRSVSSADGSALVKLGNTTVVCGIKAEVGKPEAVNPNRGRLDVSLTLDPLCSPSFSIGKASEQCVSLGQLKQTKHNHTNPSLIAKPCIAVRSLPTITIDSQHSSYIFCVVFFTLPCHHSLF